MTATGDLPPDPFRGRLAGSLQSFRSRKRYGGVELARFCRFVRDVIAHASAHASCVTIMMRMRVRTGR
jgi:hypothetical protein